MYKSTAKNKDVMQALRTLLLLYILFSPHLLLAKDDQEGNRMPKIHVLLLGDTTDKKVGESAKVDIEKLTKSLELLAGHYEMNLCVHQRTSEQNNLTLKEILKWLDSQAIHSNDLLVIYYTGHGFRYKHDKHIWPQGLLRDDKHREKGVSFTKIVKKAIDKRAQLTLILLDCCNNVIAKNGVIETHDEDKCDNPNCFHLKDVCKEDFHKKSNTLFKKHGVILASASSPKEVSWGKQCGGLFTNLFLSILFDELTKEYPKWSRIFKTTRQECYDITLTEYQQEYIAQGIEGHHYQKPQFRICLSHTQKNPSTYFHRIFKQSIAKKHQHYTRSPDDIYESGDLDFHALAEYMDAIHEE